MGSQQQEKFQIEYQAGKEALEKGEYRLSLEHLRQAHQLVLPQSYLGGEVAIWLVTAYQALRQFDEAITLCQQLSRHPHLEIRQQSKNLLYIIQAPQLQRPQEWMSKIPNLDSLSESDLEYRRGSNKPKKTKLYHTESVDLSQVNTQDNQFLWVALVAIILMLLGIIFSGNF